MTAGPTGAAAASSVRLTHVNERGEARMVDVTGKAVTHRIAEARCQVHTVVDVARLGSDRPGGGGLLASARFAGIMAAKRTSALIPLCHPIRLDAIDVRVRTVPTGFAVAAVASVVDRTGVEMEALTACTATALALVQALWEMDLDPRASIDDVTLWHKSGGRSGTWDRGAGGEAPPGPNLASADLRA